MKKFVFLLLLTLLPVLVALCGYNNIGFAQNVPHRELIVRNLLVNPLTIAMLGGIVGMIVKSKRAMWWSMIVCFFYSYLGLGLVWGGFYQEGPFGSNTLNSSALMAVVGFVAALFLYGLTTVLRKSLASIR